MSKRREKKSGKNMSEADADVYHQWGMIILTIYPFPELHRLLACSCWRCKHSASRDRERKWPGKNGEKEEKL
jgi:hypothetical protein